MSSFGRLSTSSTATINRKHPRLTIYRAATLLVMLALAFGPSVAAYQGLNGACTTLNLVLGVLLAILYWIGLYEYECSGSGRLRFIFRVCLLKALRHLCFRNHAASFTPGFLGKRKRAVDVEQGLQPEFDENANFNVGTLSFQRSSNEIRDPFVDGDVSSDASALGSRGFVSSPSVDASSALIRRTPATAARSIREIFQRTLHSGEFESQADLRSHCSVNSDHHFCSICDLLLDSRKSLKKHHRKFHYLPCPRCKKSFKNSDGLAQHMQYTSKHA